MAERDVPEADLFEQDQPVTPGSGAGREPESAPGVEVPEADALEQSLPVGPEPRVWRRSSDIEVPEADALEQAEEIVDDDDGWSRG